MRNGCADELGKTLPKKLAGCGVRPPQPVLTGHIASRVDLVHPDMKEAVDGSTGRSTEAGGVATAAAAV